MTGGAKGVLLQYGTQLEKMQPLFFSKDSYGGFHSLIIHLDRRCIGVFNEKIIGKGGFKFRV